MKKRGREEEELYKKRKKKRCKFEDLILEVLAVDIDRGINNGLKKRAEAEGGRGREKEGREKEEEEGGGEEEGKGIKELIKYLGEVKKWGKLKIFRVIKEVWWIMKE